MVLGDLLEVCEDWQGIVVYDNACFDGNVPGDFPLAESGVPDIKGVLTPYLDNTVVGLCAKEANLIRVRIICY